MQFAGFVWFPWFVNYLPALSLAWAAGLKNEKIGIETVRRVRKQEGDCIYRESQRQECCDSIRRIKVEAGQGVYSFNKLLLSIDNLLDIFLGPRMQQWPQGDKNSTPCPKAVILSLEGKQNNAYNE